MSFHPKPTAEYRAAKSVAKIIAGSNPTLRRMCLVWQLQQVRHKKLLGIVRKLARSADKAAEQAKKGRTIRNHA